MLVSMRLVRPEQTHSNHDLAGADLAAAQAAGLRNELVVLDPLSRETRSGTDGLLWILDDNTGHHVLVRLLALRGFRHVLRWGYQVISYNRRIISPPRHQIVCDCEPEVTLARRASLIVPLALASILLAAVVGGATFRACDWGPALEGAWCTEAAIGLAWLALVAAALVGLRSVKRIDYLGHLAVTTLVAMLVMVPPSLIALALPTAAATALVGLAGAGSLALSSAMQRRRTQALGLSRAWLVGWPVTIVAAAVASWLWWAR
jgi:hypothetical protein